jgi:predicted transcriptional regulator
MPTKRSKEQIITQILDLCQGGDAGKTKIVYQVNLNFQTVNNHLDLLLKKGFLETIQGEKILYRTTPRGEEALESLRIIKEIYS